MESSRRWQIVRAYLAGCFAATLIVAIRLIIKAPDALVILTALLLIGMVASIVMTIVPFLMLAYLAETRATRSVAYYLLSGIVLAIIAAFASYGPQTIAVMTADKGMLIAFLTAGAAGGATYWYFAGAKAGTRD